MDSLRRCLSRLETKRPQNWEQILEDYDLQDIITVNLERAVQLSVDIGLQVLGTMDVTAPQSMADVFSRLSSKGVIPVELAGKLQAAVGFRNIAVHEYEEIDWKIVHSILSRHLNDFSAYIKAILEY